MLQERQEISGADVLTCHYRAFSDDAFPYEGSQPMYTYNPPGGPVEAGILENVFGDANCIMKKSVFESVGGFVRDRAFALSDWEIFARICMHGYKLMSYLLSCFFTGTWRKRWAGREDPYHNRQMLVKTYCEHWNQLSPQTIVADVILANQPGVPLLHGKNIYALHAEMEYLRRAVISARAWRKQGWFKRAFNKWREPK